MLGRTLSAQELLDKNCLHKTTDTKFYHFKAAFEYLLKKTPDDVVCSSSIVFKCKAVVDKTFIRKMMKKCKSIVRVDACIYKPTACVN